MKRTAIAAFFIFAAAVFAQAPDDLSGGAYSEAQAERGAEMYAARCASCHLADLSGEAQSPSLAGIGFAFVWGGRPLSELFGAISRNMPPEQPGGLPPSSYADILAFILRANDYPAGSSELPGDEDALAKFTIPAF